MNRKELVRLIKEDYRRFELYKGRGFVKDLFWEESLQVTFLFRLCSYFKERKGIFYKLFFAIFRLLQKHIEHKTGIQLPACTIVGGGLRFFHYNCIVIAQSVIIGKNASIHQGVTLGRVYNGKKSGVPTLGDNVVVFAGAKILGGIHIGNNVVVGANAVVVNDVPDNAVVVGVPARVISNDSSKCFDSEWLRNFNFVSYE
ncbi:MAG: serine acetyltransferase [Paludibacteraceae bacterium]|nr:serine acetyltransferase [Paludibacteraceae bacterium]